MRRIISPRTREHEAKLLDELTLVYQTADHTFAGWSCPASTECCRFGLTGREPYVTSIELAAIRRALAARGGPRSLRPPSPLPASNGKRKHLTLAAERPCPMLTDAGRCAIYLARPLGCRTFYCDRAEPCDPVRHRDIVSLVHRVQEIAARHEPGGDVGRPLTRALRP